MNDLISRKDAIDAVGSMLRRKFGIGGDLAEITLAGLPPAYPETDSFCTDCKEYDSEKHFCPRFDRVIKQAVEDLQIVKCKDCKYWNTADGKFGICEAVHYDDEVGTYKIRVECSMEDYCSWAERREDG